jgi:membrane protein YqaA with SNARE-associated domain
LTTEAKAEAVLARAAPEWNRREWQGVKMDDQLMREIPLLIAPVPLEPQQAPKRMRFKAVVANGMLMLGAVLAAILAGALNLKDLPSLKTMALAAVAVLGVVYWILRRVKQRRA